MQYDAGTKGIIAIGRDGPSPDLSVLGGARWA
jgi:hypothetical protein